MGGSRPGLLSSWGAGGVQGVLLQLLLCQGGRGAMGSGESWPDPGSCSPPSSRQRSPNPTPSPSRSQRHAPCTAALPPPPAPQSPLVMLQRLPATCSRVPGSRRGCVPPTLLSLPVVLQSPAVGLGRGECEHHRRRGEAAAGPARTGPSSHSEEHPRPSPEQLHIPPGALTAPASPAPGTPSLPAAPSALAPRGRSPPLPVAAPGPWIYTCRRAARPWPARQPRRWPP